MNFKKTNDQRSLLQILLSGYLLVAGIIGLVGLIHLSTGTPMSYYLKDPAQLFDNMPLVGVLQYVGYLFWCSCTVICFFTAILLKQFMDQSEKWFFILSGILSFCLLMDDMFILHEYVFPVLLHISEKYVYIGGIFLILSHMLYFRKIVLKHNYILLVLAVFLLFLHFVFDYYLWQWIFSPLFEDGFKLLGIYTWFIFFANTSYMRIKKRLTIPPRIQ